MSNSGSSKDSESPETPKQRSNKSVRWTGQDYFSYSGASGNRSGRGQQENQRGGGERDKDKDDEFSESSDSDSESDDDEHAINVRAATRANTWFNRLRSDEIDKEREGREGNIAETSGTRYEDSEEPLTGRSRGPGMHSPTPRRDESDVPQIQISHHPEVNPYSNILDIGTEVSAGLAPGGREVVDNDPLDSEYRERRNRLLASIGTHSQPASPTLEALDPLDDSSIPLKDLHQEHFGSHRANAPTSPNLVDEQRSSEDETAKEAEKLREKLQSTQRQRAHQVGRVIAERMKNEERAHGAHARKNSDSNSHADSFDSEKRNNEEQEEELRRLEEIARQEAEEHAKNLVQAHLASNLLKPNSNNDGYVDNHRYLLDAGMLDEDIPLEEEHEEEASAGKHENKPNKTESGLHKVSSKDESSSDDTLKNEKGNYKQEPSNDDNSDSDSDSEDERKDVSLRGDPDYIPPPKKVKEGVLGSLLRLYAGQEDDDDKSSVSTTVSPGVSPSNTPLSTPLGSPGQSSHDETPSEYPSSASQSGSLLVPGNAPPSASKKWKRPGYFRTHSSEDALGRETKGRPKWYKRPSSSNTPSINQLASSGLSVAGGAASNAASSAAHHAYPHTLSRKMGKFTQSIASDFADAGSKLDKRAYDEAYQREKESKRRAKKAEQQRKEKERALKKARIAEQKRITVHIADVLQRQRFLLRLGRALMLFGAPSHRLEEYLRSSARVLEIDAQVLYIPGCILVSFGDATTHTSETKLIRVTQGLNLSKLHATHLVYKEVVHDLMSLEEASSHIDQILRSKNVYPWWLVVFFYGLACMCCGMFAYGAFWRDMPIIFFLGGGVGFLQFWVQPRSDLYANVFEVSSSIFVSFVGRAFGSIGSKNDYVFCFASIVQASIALILPGYIILVGALELQTKNLVAGSVRMFYANIYSLFLSFGITLGSAIFGWIYNGAVTDTQCQRYVDPKWKILFVPAATLFMALVNQAGLRQLPIMIIIGSSGYAVQYFVAANVKAAAFTSAIGAFTMGVIGNLYSRVGHGLAFAAMLPGIFVLVPSGVAAQGSLVAGVKVATEIVNASKSEGSSSSSADTSAQTISDLGNSMTQVAVGIVVGLFAATLVVYPLGFKKKRSGLFTF